MKRHRISRKPKWMQVCAEYFHCIYLNIREFPRDRKESGTIRHKFKVKLWREVVLMKISFIRHNQYKAKTGLCLIKYFIRAFYKQIRIQLSQEEQQSSVVLNNSWWKIFPAIIITSNKQHSIIKFSWWNCNNN